MDEAVRKKILRKINYGLFVATSDAASATINWVSQVSFKPPVIAVAIQKTSGLNAAMTSSKKFALSFLGKNQKAVAKEFFKSPTLQSGKLAGFDIEMKTTGCPILKDCLGAVECEVMQKLDFGGDHDIFLGNVVDAHCFSDEPPLGLLETGWSYGG